MDKISLKNINIVILAKNHNPSIVCKDWLMQRKIIEENIINFIHTQPLSFVETTNFNLVVDLERIQISVKEITPKNIETLQKMTENYVSNLPETPYTAIGFNFVYHITANKEIMKDIFVLNEEKFKKLFSENYQIGGKIIFEWNGFKITLSIQPQSQDEFITNINFHTDIKGAEGIKNKLKVFHDVRKKTEEILGGLFNV